MVKTKLASKKNMKKLLLKLKRKGMRVLMKRMMGLTNWTSTQLEHVLRRQWTQKMTTKTLQMQGKKRRRILIKLCSKEV